MSASNEAKASAPLSADEYSQIGVEAYVYPLSADLDGDHAPPDDQRPCRHEARFRPDGRLLTYPPVSAG